MAELPHSDYRGQPLAVGDTVAFISKGFGGPALFTGRVALVHGAQLRIESGTITTLTGTESGGNSYSGGKAVHPNCVRHATVHFIENADSAGASE